MSRQSVAAEEEFISFFPGKRNYVYQFHDTKQAKAGRVERIFTSAQPADFIVTSEGVTFYAEVKYCAELTSFPFSNIRKSQWISAAQQTAASGLYYFFIKSEAMRCWYKVPATILLHHPRKSITWQELSIHVFHP